MSYREQWEELDRLLSSALEDPAVPFATEIWPTKRKLSFFRALDTVCKVNSDTNEVVSSAEILSLGERVEALERLAQNPIIAVTGMLNSGKTSLVASFLTEAGQARAPRGFENNKGTNRFVLWVPQAWQQKPEVWSLLLEHLHETFGERAESLATDPSEAHSQYNNTKPEKLGVPLLATDSSLDALGFGLLDCPDVQSGISQDNVKSKNIRLEFLGRAAGLCSAFIVLTKFGDYRDMIFDTIVRTIGERMQGVSQYVAVNLIRPPYTPGQVWKDVGQVLKQHKIEAYFGAYDYYHRDSKQYIPPLPKDFPHTHSDSLPMFYELHASDDQNPPHPIGSERFLHQLAYKLDKGRLFKAASSALWNQLLQKIHEGIEHVKSCAEMLGKNVSQRHDALVAVYLELLGQKGDEGNIVALRLRITGYMAGQLTDSIVSNTPWYLKPSLKLNQQFRNSQQWLSTTLSQLNPLSKNRLKDKAEEFIRGKRGSYITQDELAHIFRAHGLSEIFNHDSQALRKACHDIIERFQKENTTTFDKEKLDQACAVMWEKISTGQKMKGVVAAAISLIVSLAALLVIPFDAGATAVLTTTVGQLLLAEVGVAASVAGVIALLVGTTAMKGAEQQAALVQFGDWFAIACDAFGLPRRIQGRPLQIDIDGVKKDIPESQIRQKTSRLPQVALLQVHDEFITRLNSLLTDHKDALP